MYQKAIMKFLRSYSKVMYERSGFEGFLDFYKANKADGNIAKGATLLKKHPEYFAYCYIVIDGLKEATSDEFRKACKENDEIQKAFEKHDLTKDELKVLIGKSLC